MDDSRYYPDSMEKPNQDALTVKTEVAHEPDALFFGIFDGHGTSGTECAQFAKDRVSRASRQGLGFRTGRAARLSRV